MIHYTVKLVSHTELVLETSYWSQCWRCFGCRLS